MSIGLQGDSRLRRSIPHITCRIGFFFRHSRRRRAMRRFHVFGCKCFILIKGKNLDKFEARSVDGIFFGYASHSRAFRVPNLETNQIV
jgi:hypothetical protein